MRSNLLSLSWTQLSGDQWQAALATQPNIVFFNGILGTEVTSSAAVSSPGDWFWGSNTLYVYSTSNPATAFTSPGIEVGARQNAVQVNTSYVTISNLHLTRSNDYGLSVSASYVTADGVTADYNHSYGLNLWQSPSTTQNGLVVQNSTVAWNGGSGINWGGYLNNTANSEQQRPSQLLGRGRLATWHRRRRAL